AVPILEVRRHAAAVYLIWQDEQPRCQKDDQCHHQRLEQRRQERSRLRALGRLRRLILLFDRLNHSMNLALTASTCDHHPASTQRPMTASGLPEGRAGTWQESVRWAEWQHWTATSSPYLAHLSRLRQGFATSPGSDRF